MVRAAFCLDSSRRSGENYSGVGFLRVAGCREFVAWRTPMVFRARRVGLAASGWPDGGWDENTSRVVRGGPGGPGGSSSQCDATWDGAPPELETDRRQAEFPVPGWIILMDEMRQ
jgi:hypothetical protein